MSFSSCPHCTTVGGGCLCPRNLRGGLAGLLDRIDWITASRDGVALDFDLIAVLALHESDIRLGVLTATDAVDRLAVHQDFIPLFALHVFPSFCPPLTGRARWSVGLVIAGSFPRVDALRIDHGRVVVTISSGRKTARVSGFAGAR